MVNGQNRFQPYADPNFGMQYSGQFSIHAYSSGPPQTILDNNNWFLQTWFWTCEDSEPFVLMTIHRCYETDLRETGTSYHHRFILGVNGDGYLFWEIGMQDTSNYNTEYIWRETTTTLKVEKGWNYVAIDFDEIYDYTYIKMYLRTEYHAGAKPFSIYEGFSKGIRKFDIDDTIVLGCMTYLALGRTGTTSPTSSDWPQPDDVLYGLCMKGWINTIEIFRNAAGQDVKFDPLFNADVDVSPAPDMDSFIISQTAYMGTTRFRIPGIVDAAADSLTISQTLLFSWDSSKSNALTNLVLSPFVPCTLRLEP